MLVGTETADDAAVYKLTDELALVLTVDFFTPIVDDPYAFGQIAAANSLSDVYAMGARPIAMLSIVGFPRDQLPLGILGEILQGRRGEGARGRASASWAATASTTPSRRSATRWPAWSIPPGSGGTSAPGRATRSC